MVLLNRLHYTEKVGSVIDPNFIDINGVDKYNRNTSTPQQVSIDLM